MRWYTLSLEREERSNEVKIWFATRSAIDDAHTTVARLFGPFVNVRRHRRRFEVARHVVHVARRGRRGILALGLAHHDVRRLSSTAAVQRLDLVADAISDGHRADLGVPDHVS